MVYERDVEPYDEVSIREDSDLDYGFDWSDWLQDFTGDTIASAVWTITDEAGDEDPAELTHVDDYIDPDNLAATWLRVKDPTVGVDYLAKCKVTLTPSGRIDSRTLRIRGIKG